MTDLLRAGIAWLGQQRVAHCSSQVTYQRPPNSYTVNATYGKTSVEVADESGMVVVAKVWDFLIQANELSFDPEPGDIIEADGRQHEVMNLNGECWRWSDPYRTTYRIHTKDTGNE
jgi:hypothetical protein